MEIPFFDAPVSLPEAEGADEDFLDAAERGDVAAMYDAFAAGASATCTDSGGTTPLIAAAQSGEFDAFRFAVTCGGDLNAATTEGNTTLHFALARCDYDERMIEYAIYHGADVNAVNNWGLPVLRCAMHTNPEVARLLVEAGADVGLLSKSDLVLPPRGSQRRLNNVQLRKLFEGSEVPSFLDALGFNVMDERPL